MNREKWEFGYPADELAKAAQQKIDYHERRLAWWQNQKKEAMQTLKQEGITIDESLIEREAFAGATMPTAQSASFRNVDYRNPTVQVRQDLMRDMNEAVAKVQEHEAKIAVYDGWHQVLTAQGDLQLRLHHDDWLFFFSRPVKGES